MEETLLLRRKFSDIWPLLDEKSRRLLAANEARSLGYGGVSKVQRACGLSRKAIAKGVHEISDSSAVLGRIRRKGAGRKKITVSNPKIIAKLEKLIEPDSRGDPENPLRWTCKSTRTLARQLNRKNNSISHVKVSQLLHDLNYSLQSNRKTNEGDDHPDRDAQFRHINKEVKNALKNGIPVISVDTKKKELIGNYKNNGQQWLPTKQAKKLKGMTFLLPIYLEHILMVFMT